jgi:hypothetical protein
MPKRSTKILALLLVCTAAFGINVQAYGASEKDRAHIDAYAATDAYENMTLAQALQSFRQTIDWERAPYAGMLFNVKNKTDLEALIDNYSVSSDWSNVLTWTAICRKLGIEQENAIKAALDNLPMVGPLPWTSNYLGVDYFGVEYKYALLGYYYAEKYDYRLDKWNKTEAYDFFRNAVNNEGHPVLFIDANGSTFTVGYGPRYYDESACTIQCYLIFYELGIADALEEALYWWNWTNNNLWYQNTHYKYGLNWSDYECEAGFFAKIITNLKYYVPDLGNWSRISLDLQNRFLADKWNSKQWFSATESKSTYVVVHHYPSNSQRRLQATIGAWTSMYNLHWLLNSTSQEAMQGLLRGEGEPEPAWRLLMNPITKLYDSVSGKFKWTSSGSVSEEATAYASVLMFLMGIVPRTAALAFPIEEYYYEYIYDIDPELYSVNLSNQTVHLSIANGGEIEFIYGSVSTAYNFSKSGVYSIVFSSDWNSIINATKVQELPNNRKFAQLIHDIAIVNVTSSDRSPLIGQTVTTEVTAYNKGNFTESFDIILRLLNLNGTEISHQRVSLSSGESVVVNFTWVPNSVGRQEIEARASMLPEDADLTDNAMTSSMYVRFTSYGLWDSFMLTY